MSRQLELLDLTTSNDATTSKQTPERQWLEWAASEWREFHRRDMTVRWARDLALVKPLLRQHGQDELKARWRTYVRTLDEYFARRGWDVPSFSVAIDRYSGEDDWVELVRRWNLRQADARDPLSGVALHRYR